MPRTLQSGIVKLTFGSTRRVSGGRRRNPAQAMSYVDQDTLAVIKRLAGDYGAKGHVKLFLNTDANRVWAIADAMEKGGRSKPSGPMEIFGVVDRKGVYGIAPEGLVEASMDAVDQIRQARLDEQWNRSQKIVDQNTSKLTAAFEALEKKFGPKFESLMAEYERAIERLEGADTISERKQAAKEVAKVVAKAEKKGGRFTSGLKAFIREVAAEPGKEANPHHWYDLTAKDIEDAKRLVKRMSVGMFTGGMLR